MTQAGPKQRITVDLPWDDFKEIKALPMSINAFMVQAAHEKLERERQEKEQGT